MDDNKIIDLFNIRSEHAVAELSQKYEKVCKQIAYNILKNKSDVEECVNDAYFKVWNTIPPNKPDHLVSYVCLAVRNIALDRVDLKNAAKRVEIVDIEICDLFNRVEYSTDIEDDLREKAFDTLLNEFLSTLDTQSRVIFVRRYFCYDKINAIANTFGKTPHAISMKLARIKEKLKDFLIQKGYEI